MEGMGSWLGALCMWVGLGVFPENELLGADFPFVFCSLCYLFILFKKWYFIIILVGFRDRGRQSMLILPFWTRSLLYSIFHFLQSVHNTSLLKIKRRLLLLCGLCREVSWATALPSFTLHLALPAGSLSLSSLCLHSLQPFPSPC